MEDREFLTKLYDNNAVVLNMLRLVESYLNDEYNAGDVDLAGVVQLMRGYTEKNNIALLDCLNKRANPLKIKQVEEIMK